MFICMFYFSYASLLLYQKGLTRNFLFTVLLTRQCGYIFCMYLGVLAVYINVRFVMIIIAMITVDVLVIIYSTCM